MTEVYIVSGFLGAGKTTWIQRLIRDAFQHQKVVLIENDFGQTSVDAALLKHQGVLVSEINAGCICCSLSGDFVRAIGGILQEHQPDVVLIEPSGVGKLSDVVKACEDATLQGKLHLAGKMTVVDATRFALYQENFGEFFEDQIRHADVVLLSHGVEDAARVNHARQAVAELNPKAAVMATAWDALPMADVLRHMPGSAGSQSRHQCACGHDHDHGNACGHDHDHGEACGHDHDHGEACDHDHDHGEACGHEHDHDNASGHDHDHGEASGHDHHDHAHTAEDVFDTLSIEPQQVFTQAGLQALFADVQALPGTLVRAKGILRAPEGTWNVQYVTGRAEILPSTAPAGMLTFIGRDLPREALQALFQA